MLDVAVGDSEKSGVLNQDHGCGLVRRSDRRLFSGLHAKWERCDEDKQSGGECNFFHGAVHRPAPSALPTCFASEATARVPGFLPVKSISMPDTWMMPFMALPSNVPENTTSVGPSSNTTLIVNVNLS